MNDLTKELTEYGKQNKQMQNDELNLMKKQLNDIIQNINSMSNELDLLIKNANAALDNGINIDEYCTDVFSHKFGFIKDENKIIGLGIFNHLINEYYSIIYKKGSGKIRLLSYDVDEKMTFAEKKLMGLNDFKECLILAKSFKQNIFLFDKNFEQYLTEYIERGR